MPHFPLFLRTFQCIMEARIFPSISIAKCPLLQAFPLQHLSFSAFISPSVKHVMGLTLLAVTACLYGTGRSVDTCKAQMRAVGTAPHQGAEQKGSAAAEACSAQQSCRHTMTKLPSAVCQQAWSAQLQGPAPEEPFSGSLDPSVAACCLCGLHLAAAKTKHGKLYIPCQLLLPGKVLVPCPPLLDQWKSFHRRRGVQACTGRDPVLSFLPFKARSGCPGRSKPGWLCIPSSILPGPRDSVRGRVAPGVPKWLSFISRRLPSQCSWLSLKALAAVESFIHSGARIIGVLEVQNSLRQLHPVHLKVTLQVLADVPQQLVSVYMCCFNSRISEREKRLL